jgi:glutathione S-transferase
MPDPIKLHMLGPSVNNLSVRVFLRAAGLPFEEVNAWGATRTPEYMAKIPSSLTPAIESPELPRGALWESCAIMMYLSNKHKLDSLYPTDPGRRAQVDAANFYLVSSIYPLLARATYEKLGFGTYAGEVATSDADDAAKAKARRDCEDALEKPFEAMRTFFIGKEGFIGDGDKPTIADIRFAASLEFCALFERQLPQWAQDYVARVEKALGKAYSEPASDVRGYVASRKPTAANA